MIVYCDSNILLKRVFAEADSPAVVGQLNSFIASESTLVSSDLAKVEIDRNIRREFGLQQLEGVGIALDHVILADLNEHILTNARDLSSRYLSTLDAIHVATAFTVRADLVLTLDNQMRAACVELGMLVGP